MGINITINPPMIKIDPPMTIIFIAYNLYLESVYVSIIILIEITITPIINTKIVIGDTIHSSINVLMLFNDNPLLPFLRTTQ